MCHNQLAQLRKTLSDLKDQNAQLLAVDPHEAWSARYLLKEAGLQTSDIRVPLLCDPSLTVSAAYGVAFGMRIHVEWSERPTTFIIDTNGVIRYARRATNYGDRPRPADIVAELKKL